jgi:hypothetical protein
MAIFRSATELRRWNDIGVIRDALESKFAGGGAKPIGLKEIAQLCGCHAGSHPGRDWHDRRDLILMIAAEWDLQNDTLEAQSEECLRCVTRLLGDGVA